MSPELQEMHDHIMSMDAHDLRDAIMDPMMLGNFLNKKDIIMGIVLHNHCIFDTIILRSVVYYMLFYSQQWEQLWQCQERIWLW